MAKTLLKKWNKDRVEGAASFHLGIFLFDITVPYVPYALLPCMSRTAFIWIAQSLFSTQA